MCVSADGRHETGGGVRENARMEGRGAAHASNPTRRETGRRLRNQSRGARHTSSEARVVKRTGVEWLFNLKHTVPRREDTRCVAQPSQKETMPHRSSTNEVRTHKLRNTRVDPFLMLFARQRKGCWYVDVALRASGVGGAACATRAAWTPCTHSRKRGSNLACRSWPRAAACPTALPGAHWCARGTTSEERLVCSGGRSVRDGQATAPDATQSTSILSGCGGAAASAGAASASPASAGAAPSAAAGAGSSLGGGGLG